MDWKLEDYTGTKGGYLRITCDGERAALYAEGIVCLRRLNPQP